MKIKNLFLFIIIPVVILASCGNSITGNVKIKTETDSLSYALGADVANSIKNFNLKELNYDAFVKGMKAVFEEQELEISIEDGKEVINRTFKKLQEEKQKEMELKSQQNLEEGVAFLEENKKKEGIIVTETGLQYEIIEEGTGASPRAIDTVVAHYTGTLLDGTVFDSSVERGEPSEFPLNRVIKGWTEGLQLMKEGAKYKFYIPTELGYGTSVRPGGKIEANMALIFEVELIEVKKGLEPGKE